MSLVILQRFDNYFYANIACTMLQHSGVECYIRDENTILADPLLSNAIGGIKLEVRETQVAEAREIMKQAEAAYLDGLICPHCNSKGLAAEEKFNTPQTILGILKNKLLYGQSTLYSKKYRCKNCKSLINELPAAVYDDEETNEE
jgi:DNA-directed RNA polymerase subunit RPC12/RpoP